MELKIWVKRAMGIMIATNIIPVICLLAEADEHKAGYLIAYLVGWCMNIVILIVWKIIDFIFWCFED